MTSRGADAIKPAALVSRVSSAPPARRNYGLSLLLSFAPLSLAAELLERTTHHRPLAAATFASLSVVVWLLAEIVVRRALSEDVSLSSLAAVATGREAGDRSWLVRGAWVWGAVSTAACLARALLG